MGKRITIKRISVFLLAIIVLLVSSSNAFAYDTTRHNKLMRDILFGYYSITNKDGTNKLKALEYASYLCLDYTSIGGENELSFLNNAVRVKGIIKSIDKIKMKSNQYHRRYTHRGWNFKYPDDRAHWNLRKEIMLKTVKEVFNYNDSKKCDAMASTIYYIHILGDYFEIAEDENRYNKYINKDAEFLGLMDLYLDGRNTDYLLKFLKQSLVSLFSFQKRTYEYSELLIFEFDEIETDLRNSSDYESFKGTCENLKDALINIVPTLMRYNTEFKNAFYRR